MEDTLHMSAAILYVLDAHVYNMLVHHQRLSEDKLNMSASCSPFMLKACSFTIVSAYQSAQISSDQPNLQVQHHVTAHSDTHPKHPLCSMCA
jgi:hypothetical protein